MSCQQAALEKSPGQGAVRRAQWKLDLSALGGKEVFHHYPLVTELYTLSALSPGLCTESGSITAEKAVKAGFGHEKQQHGN